MAENKEELRHLLMRVKEESKKAGLKLNIQKTKIMASAPTTSQQAEGEKAIDFIFWGSKILWMATAAMQLKYICSLEGKWWQA